MILGIKDFSHDADGHGDVVYGDHVRHPLPYQDKMEALIESKLIQFNIDKSCFLILGSKKARTQLQTELTTYPLTLCDFTLKESLLIGSNQSLISAKTTPTPNPPPSTNFSKSLIMLLT